MGNRTDAKAMYDAGLYAAQHHRNHNNGLTQAFSNFVSASYADPTWGEAHYAVGNNNADLKFPHVAISAYRRALECENSDENRAKIYCNLGWQLGIVGQLEEAIDYLQKSVELDSSLGIAWMNLSMLHYAVDQTETAVSCALKARELMPDDATAETNLAFAYMHNRQFKEGFEAFEARFRYKLHQYLSMPFTRWRGEKDKTLFVAADQGLGDTISFARFVERTARISKFVHLCVQPELMRLFEHSFSHLKNTNIIPTQSPFPAYDHWTTFVSLPHCLGLSTEDIINEPHIAYRGFSNDARRWKVSDRKLHIGIAWAGSKLNDINHHRSIPLTQFLDLYRVPGIQLYSLQKDERRQDLFDTGAISTICDLSGHITDVSDTVAIMKKLDLIICCESAPGHIAALADVECWIPYSRLGKDWRIGPTGRNAIWTPKHKFFLQGDDPTWQSAFDRIVASLREKVGSLDEQGSGASSKTVFLAADPRSRRLTSAP